MLLLNEDISPVRMPAARSRAGNDNGLCKYKASAIKALQSTLPARGELRAAQGEAGEPGPGPGSDLGPGSDPGSAAPVGGEDGPHLGWVPQYHRAESAQPGDTVLASLTRQGGSGRPNVVVGLGFVTAVTEALVS